MRGEQQKADDQLESDSAKVLCGSAPIHDDRKGATHRGACPRQAGGKKDTRCLGQETREPERGKEPAIGRANFRFPDEPDRLNAGETSGPRRREKSQETQAQGDDGAGIGEKEGDCSTPGLRPDRSPLAHLERLL